MYVTSLMCNYVTGACALLSDQPADAVEQVRTGDSAGAGGATAGGGDEKTEESRV